MSYDIFATLGRLSARYRVEFHKFKLVDGKRVNWYGLPVDEAYAVVSDERARAIETAELGRFIEDIQRA